MEREPVIVYFDGVCGLCNQTVDFLIVRDKERRLRFAPLQGETARQNLSEQDRTTLDSLVVTYDDKTFRRSAGVVRVLWQLPGLWKLAAAALWIIPLPLRNLGYRLVAQSRYKLFGQKESCRLPAPEEAAAFLP